MSLQMLFTQHPRSIGESYLEHQRQAFAFGSAMLRAGVACLLHGLVPALFLDTGSRTVTSLYERMVVNRRARARPTVRAPLRAVVTEECLEPPPGGFWAA